jgi:hypothetical protein
MPLADSRTDQAAATAKPQRRRSSFAISVGAAFGLNLLVLSVYATTIGHWQVPARTPAHTTWITATQPTPAAPRPVPPPLLSTATPAPQFVAPVERPAAELLPADDVFAAASVLPPSREEVGEGNEVRFYKSAEVDRPAEPEPDADWNLDPAVLDTAGVQTLVFDIFVSSAGEVVECAIVEPESLPDDARLVLETRLRQSVLQPALRHNEAVASVRRIEVSVLPPGS